MLKAHEKNQFIYNSEGGMQRRYTIIETVNFRYKVSTFLDLEFK